MLDGLFDSGDDVLDLASTKLCCFLLQDINLVQDLAE